MVIKYHDSHRISGVKADRTNDSLGSSADGTNNGVTLDTTNKKLGTSCYSFDGTNDYVDISDKFDDLTQTGSVSFWIKPNTISDNDVILDSSNVTGTNNGFAIFLPLSDDCLH